MDIPTEPMRTRLKKLTPEDIGSQREKGSDSVFK
jgi:hypothetical protein